MSKVYENQRKLLKPNADRSGYVAFSTKKLRFTEFRYAGIPWDEVSQEDIRSLIKVELKGGQKPHPLAFQYVIRDDKTGFLYKYTPIDLKMPKGYTVVYQAKAGHLLPDKFKEELSFHDSEED